MKNKVDANFASAAWEAKVILGKSAQIVSKQGKCYCGNQDCVPRALDSGSLKYLDLNKNSFIEISKKEEHVIEISNGDVMIHIS